jgi:ArsR family transcriptional regulator
MKRPPAAAVESRELARLAKALAHPARIAILRFLARQSNCYCGQIVDELPLAQSTVSQHLAELKDAGLIRGTVDGVKSCYCLDDARLAAAAELFGGFLAGLRSAPKSAASGRDSACCPPASATSPRRATV